MYGVALRKESVDRNKALGLLGWLRVLSLSARRAWIEIHRDVTLRLWACVALRKESVDRNYSAILSSMGNLLSLSARRAWIEMGA